MKRVSRIAPMAPQVAAGQADENAGQSRKRGLSLNRLEDFRDNHKAADPKVGATSRLWDPRFPQNPSSILPYFLSRPAGNGLRGTHGSLKVPNETYLQHHEGIARGFAGTTGETGSQNGNSYPEEGQITYKKSLPHDKI
jgi:hypothetical protein